MKKICCFKCEKYTKIKKTKISYILNESILLSTSCNMRGNSNDKICGEKNCTEILGLATNNNI